MLLLLGIIEIALWFLFAFGFLRPPERVQLAVIHNSGWIQSKNNFAAIQSFRRDIAEIVRESYILKALPFAA